MSSKVREDMFILGFAILFSDYIITVTVWVKLLELVWLYNTDIIQEPSSEYTIFILWRLTLGPHKKEN